MHINVKYTDTHGEQHTWRIRGLSWCHISSYFDAVLVLLSPLKTLTTLVIDVPDRLLYWRWTSYEIRDMLSEFPQLRRLEVGSCDARTAVVVPLAQPSYQSSCLLPTLECLRIFWSHENGVMFSPHESWPTVTNTETHETHRVFPVFCDTLVDMLDHRADHGILSLRSVLVRVPESTAALCRTHKSWGPFEIEEQLRARIGDLLDVIEVSFEELLDDVEAPYIESPASV
ncbi:hypothetical protein C8Q74DRAFT_12611 [Fomes fomentarius]|nr:hypothetical protein C8Q74DRAFT_12611 [Fomes fomentarius]